FYQATPLHSLPPFPTRRSSDLVAPRQLASAPARCRSPPRQLGEGVAAVHTGDGGGIDRSRVVAHRGIALSGATVATAVDSLRSEIGRATSELQSHLNLVCRLLL